MAVGYLGAHHLFTVPIMPDSSLIIASNNRNASPDLGPKSSSINHNAVPASVDIAQGLSRSVSSKCVVKDISSNINRAVLIFSLNNDFGGTLNLLLACSRNSFQRHHNPFCQIYCASTVDALPKLKFAAKPILSKQPVTSKLIEGIYQSSVIPNTGKHKCLSTLSADEKKSQHRLIELLNVLLKNNLAENSLQGLDKRCLEGLVQLFGEFRDSTSQASKVLCENMLAKQLVKQEKIRALSKNGHQLRYMSAEDKDDPDLVWAAFVQSPMSIIREMSDRLRDDKPFALKLVRQAGSLGFLSDQLQRDREVALAAVQRDPLCLSVLFRSPTDNPLKFDKEIALAAVRQWPSTCRYVNPRPRCDPDILMEVSRSQPL